MEYPKAACVIDNVQQCGPPIRLLKRERHKPLNHPRVREVDISLFDGKGSYGFITRDAQSILFHALRQKPAFFKARQKQQIVMDCHLTCRTISTRGSNARGIYIACHLKPKPNHFAWSSLSTERLNKWNYGTLAVVSLCCSWYAVWTRYGRNIRCLVSQWALATDKHILCPKMLLPGDVLFLHSVFPCQDFQIWMIHEQTANGFDAKYSIHTFKALNSFRKKKKKKKIALRERHISVRIRANLVSSVHSGGIFL